MKPLRTFFVQPNLPDRLAVLKEMAYNISWSWRTETRDLFSRVSRDLWVSSGHNPVRMLGEVEPEEWQRLLENEAFLAQLDRAETDFREYLSGDTAWLATAHTGIQDTLPAYFPAEFGTTDCVRI